jgi:hypothetical protein
MRYFTLFLVVVLAPVCALAQPIVHSADQNGDYVISLTEMLRVTQLHNLLGLHCDSTTEDGFAPGWIGDQTDCLPHSSDYNPQDWRIDLGELLRIIQFFNIGTYHECAEGEDGFCPGPGPEVETVLLADWRGLFLSEAAPAISAQGLTTLVVDQYDPVVPAGIILDQVPGVGLVPVSSIVTLTVSAGPDPNPVLFEATLATTDPDTTYTVGEFGHFTVTVSNGVPPYEVRVGWPDAGSQSATIDVSGGSTSADHLWDADTGGGPLPLRVRVTDSSATPQVLNLELLIQVDPAPAP